MTEEEWLTATDYRAVFIYLRGDVEAGVTDGLYSAAGHLAVGEGQRVSGRKLRLLAAAFCEKWWGLPLDDPGRTYLTLYERLANDPAAWEDVIEHGQVVQQPIYPGGQPTIIWPNTPCEVAGVAGALAWSVAYHVARDSIAVTCKDATEEDRWEWGWVGPPDPLWQSTLKAAEEEHPPFLREIIGNPFRPAPFIDPVWLAANDSAILKIAQGIYDDRAFDRLPILADALEEAGCDNADMLDHCRREGKHVRGCWLVDSLLMKD